MKKTVAVCLTAALLLTFACSCSLSGGGKQSSALELDLHIYENRMEFSIPTSKLDGFAGVTDAGLAVESQAAKDAGTEYAVERFLDIAVQPDLQADYAAEEGVFRVTLSGTPEEISRVLFEIKQSDYPYTLICSITYRITHGAKRDAIAVTCAAGTFDRQPFAQEALVSLKPVDHRS